MVNRMKYSFMALCLLLSVGCASQPSVYEDKSTANQRNITATGAAAVEAAKSNNSSNVNVKAEVKPNGYIVYDSNGQRDHRAELMLLQKSKQYKQPSYSNFAATEFKREFNRRANRSIDAEIDRLMDKIF